MLEASKRVRLREPNRRGNFIPLNARALYGGGSQVSTFLITYAPCAELLQFPGNLRDLAENTAISNELQQNQDIQRMAGFSNSKLFRPPAQLRLTAQVA